MPPREGGRSSSSVSSLDSSQPEHDSLLRRREDEVGNSEPESDTGAIPFVEEQQEQSGREPSISLSPSANVGNNSFMDDVFVCVRAPGCDGQQEDDGSRTANNGAGVFVSQDQQTCSHDPGGNNACGLTHRVVARVAPVLGDCITTRSQNNQHEYAADTPQHGNKIHTRYRSGEDVGVDDRSGCGDGVSSNTTESMTMATAAAAAAAVATAATATRTSRASMSSVGSAAHKAEMSIMIREEELDVIAELSDYFLTRGVVKDSSETASAARVCLALLTQSLRGPCHRSPKPDVSSIRNNSRTTGYVDDQQQCGYIGEPTELVALACDHLAAAPAEATTVCALLQWLLTNNLIASRLATDRQQLLFFVSPGSATFEDDDHGGGVLQRSPQNSITSNEAQSIAIGAAAKALSEAGLVYGEIMDNLGRATKTGAPFRKSEGGRQISRYK